MPPVQSFFAAKVIRRFPFQVALGALLFYGFTLSHGVTFNSLALTAKIAGWDWQPMAGHPLLWLLTLPLRLLPAGLVPWGLNLFSAICGAATLGILARSLELLPWFRPLAGLNGWSARLPVLLAVAACGLEFSFWQDATAATGEMLDLLLLAAAVWLVLEYRVAKNGNWLAAAALVWGAGMAESWVMQITLPLFIASLVWLRRLRFFKLQFILSGAVMGLAGFATYALLPMVNGLLPGSPWNLAEAWIQSLRASKILLQWIYNQFWAWHPMMALVAALFFILPLAALLLPFGNAVTKNKSRLDRAQIWIFRGVGAGLLLFSVWLAFDPIFGLRQLLAGQISVALPLLTFDYLNALAIGFLAGNLLLILQPRERTRPRRKFKHQLVAGLRQAAVPVLSTLLTVLVLGLAARNLLAITLVNRQSLRQFGELQWRSLPPGGGIVLSDFPTQLDVFQAAQASFRDQPQWLPVDLTALPKPEYRAQLTRLGLDVGPAPDAARDLDRDQMLLLLDGFAQNHRVFYLHPSSTFLSELFYTRPAGLVHELIRYPSGAINPPRLAAPAMAENEKAWDNFAPEIASLQPPASPAKPSLFDDVDSYLYLAPVASGQTRLLQEWFSLALDDWGAQLQRHGLLPAARRRFDQAFQLNPNNWIARLNLYCNANLQSRTNDMSLLAVSGLAAQLRSAQNRASAVSYLGPMDEPDGCFILGNDYQQAGLLRMAMQQYDRARVLAPRVLAPEFALAELYGRCGLTNQAMATLNHLHGEIKSLPDTAGFDLQLALVEAGVWMSESNQTRAAATLQEAVQRHPHDPAALNQISTAYYSFGDFTSARQLADRILEQQPDDISALLMQSSVLLQTRRADLAIPVLNHVLSLTNSASVKLIRAIAYVETRNYAAAGADYHDLEQMPPSAFQADYGLAQIAELQHDTNTAVHYLKLCLTNAPPDTAQSRKVRERLDALQSPPPGA
ncbi:MAG TPA: tetratricopeptide repeat protein [Verrucomicrobiae bacterium]|nr:tetratricopeptide repeat protein [Verrucomicrobiae bacterium]